MWWFNFVVFLGRIFATKLKHLKSPYSGQYYARIPQIKMSQNWLSLPKLQNCDITSRSHCTVYKKGMQSQFHVASPLHNSLSPSQPAAKCGGTLSTQEHQHKGNLSSLQRQSEHPIQNCQTTGELHENP